MGIDKYLNMKKIFLLKFLILTYTGTNLFGQGNSISITNIRADHINLAGFTLKSDKEIHIKAIGAGGDKKIMKSSNFFVDPENMFAYSWIIDARTRKLKWRMTINNTDDDWWDKFNRIFDDKVFLEKGEYELYYTAIEPVYLSFGGGFLSLEKILNKTFGGDTWWEDQAGKWNVTVSGVDEIFEKSAVLKYQQAVNNSAIVTLDKIGETELQKTGFSLNKKARFKVYAIGEGDKSDMYDYAYILDADSRTRIWEMKYNNTEHAGGALKNRYIEEEITLRPGDYMVYYKSDVGHSFDYWNANPPYDPNFWGVTLTGTGPDFDKSIITEYQETEGSLIVALDRMGDYEDVSEGFKLLKPAKIRIYALGEGRNGNMFDYGWIEDARNGRKIWEMNFYDTEHAGGGDKNRMIDRIIHFDPGSYIVHYITDDSHSYRDWNTTEPYDPQAWGIRLYSVGKKESAPIVAPYEPEKDKNAIVQLIRVGNDEHVKKQFILRKSTDVKILAIGEGEWEEMYDYAWIEDFQTGRTVWKMKYRDTRRAGGDSKNRLFDGSVHLKAGTYIAHFRTDDSHAYGDWNASPPRNKANWGLTIYSYEK